MYFSEKMRLVLIIPLFLSVVVGLKPKQLLTFTIEGRNVAGLPDLKQQFTGVDFNGTVLLQTHDQTTLIVKFANMTYSKLHGDFENGWWNDAHNLDRKTKQLPITSLPFVIQIQKNVMKKIIVPANIKDWELNFAKGVFNQLISSVNINSANDRSVDNSVSKAPASSGEKPINSYTTMEDSVIGRCEVQYDIVKIPQGTGGLGSLFNYPTRKSLCGRKSLYEITKTYNYSNCEFLAETHFNFPSSREDPHCKPGSSSCENFWKRSTLTRAVACSDSYGFVLDSVTTSTMSANLQMHDESKAVVHAKLNITLSKIESDQSGGFKSAIPKNTKHISDFTYSYTQKRWDASSKCDPKVLEKILGQNDESKKIRKVLFDIYNEKCKGDNCRPTRSVSSKNKGKKSHKSSTMSSNEGNTFDQDDSKNKDNYNNGQNSDDSYRSNYDNKPNDNDFNGQNFDNSNKNNYDNKPNDNDSNGRNFDNSDKNSYDNKPNDNDFSGRNFDNNNKNNYDNKPNDNDFNGRNFDNSDRNNYDNKPNDDFKGRNFDNSDRNNYDYKPNSNNFNDYYPDNNYGNNFNMGKFKEEEDKYYSNNDDNNDRRVDDNNFNRNKNLDDNQNNYNNEETSDSNIWNSQPIGMHDPPFMPLTPFSLSHDDGDVRNCLQEIFKDMLDQIAYDFANKSVPVEEGTMEKIVMAVDMCQIMSFKELSQLSDLFFHSPSNNRTLSDELAIKRQLFRDIVVASGTKPALSLISKWIDNDQLSSDEGVIIFTSLPAKLKSGDKKTVNFYFELVKKVTSNKNQQMSIAAVIGFSNFVRISCIKGNTKVNRFNPQVEQLCSSKDAENYVDWMSNKLNSDNNKMFRVYSLAIGNTGTKGAIRILKSVATDSNLSRYQRSNAIFAMKYLTSYYPNYIEPILFSLYSNYSVPVPIRLSALSSLIFSQPSLTIWMRIAISTWYEPNFAVMYFIQSTIESLSDSFKRNPETRLEMTRSASLVRHLMKPKVAYPPIPDVYNIIEQSYMKDMDSCVLEHISWFGSADFMSIYHRHQTQMSAFTSNYEAEISTANPDGLISSLTLLIFPPNDDITKARPPIPDLKRSTRWIQKKLGLTPRNPSPLEGDVHFKINNLMESILPFDRKTTVSFASWGKEFLSRLKSEGVQKNIQKTDMSSSVLSTTTELGFPVRLQLRVPWVFQSKTNMKLTDSNTLDMTFSLKFSSGMNGELSFFTPWDNTSYVTGLYGSCFGQVPELKLKMELSHDKSSVRIHVDPIDESKLFFHSTFPFTSQKDLLTNQLISSSAETHIIHVGQMKMRTINPCPQLSGIYKTEGKLMNSFEALSQIKLNHHPLMWHSNKLTHIEIKMNRTGQMIFNTALERALSDEGYIILSHHDNYYHSGSVSTEQIYKPRRQVTRSIWSWLGFGSKDSATEAPSTMTEASTNNNLEQQVTTSSDVSATTSASFTPHHDNRPNMFSNYENGEFKEESLRYNNNGEIFNASTLDPFVHEVNGSSQLYLINQVLNGIESGHAVVIGLNATIYKPDGDIKKYSNFWAYGATHSKMLQRIGFFSTANDSNWQTGFTATFEMPPLPAFDLAPVANNETQPYFSAVYFQQSEDRKMSVSVKGVIRQLGSILDLNKEIEECQRPKTAATSKCRRLHERVTSFSGMKLNVTMNDEKHEMGLNDFADFTTVFGRNFLVYHNSSRTRKSSNDDSYSSNVLQLSASLSKDLSQWNSWVNTSTFDIYFRGIPNSFKPMTSSAATLYKEMMQINSQYCGITNDKILTFDGVELNYKMSDCWHVAAKDVSGKSRIVVLTRALQNSTYLDLEMNLDNYKIINITDGAVRVNNEEVTVSPNNKSVVVFDRTGVLLVKIEQTVDYGLDFTMPAHGFRLTYTNTSAVIYAYSGMQSRLSGLCGDYNMETFGELRNPKGVILNSDQEFGLSYSINDGNCVKLV